MKPLVLGALNGDNAAILMYGATNSGKTYTMNTVIRETLRSLMEGSQVQIEIYNNTFM